MELRMARVGMGAGGEVFIAEGQHFCKQTVWKTVMPEEREWEWGFE